MKGRLIVAALAAAVLVQPATGLAQRDTSRVGAGGEQRSDGPARRTWTDTVERTAEGGFRIGNPNARVKLVEYFSLTCSHCATFAAQGGDRLFNHYVQRGTVSVEYRNYVLNGYDVAAALLTRCGTPQQYFTMSHALLGGQRQWLGAAQNLTEAQRTELAGLPQQQLMPRLAAVLGLPAIARRHGITAAQAQACLTNQTGVDEIDRMVRAASALGVEGTPTFFINGVRQDVNTWADIEPLLGG